MVYFVDVVDPGRLGLPQFYGKGFGLDLVSTLVLTLSSLCFVAVAIGVGIFGIVVAMRPPCIAAWIVDVSSQGSHPPRLRQTLETFHLHGPRLRGRD